MVESTFAKVGQDVVCIALQQRLGEQSTWGDDVEFEKQFLLGHRVGHRTDRLHDDDHDTARLSFSLDVKCQFDRVGGRQLSRHRHCVDQAFVIQGRDRITNSRRRVKSTDRLASRQTILLDRLPIRSCPDKFDLDLGDRLFLVRILGQQRTRK